MTETDREEILFHDILACCRALEEKKADELLILDLRGISSITDYFIIASGKSEPHLKALRTDLEKTVKERGIELVGVDASPKSGWMVIDAFDFMVHLFLPEIREQYRLESLWKDAEIVRLENLAIV